jgi:tricorn protease
MRHRKIYNQLSRTSSHRNAMLSNMAVSLILHKRINTTVTKAKALRAYVEPLLTKSKEDTTHSRRVVFSYLQNKEAVTELFREISPKIADRPGGYTRIIKTDFRLGDNADMCMMELVDFNDVYLAKESVSADKGGRRRRRGSGKTRKDQAAAPAVEETTKTEVEQPEMIVEQQVDETPEEIQTPEPRVDDKIVEKQVDETPDETQTSSSPSFSPCGKYLFFSSMRSFNPIYSWTEWNHVYADMVKVYLVTLDKNTTSPFEPKDDTPEVKKDEQPAKDKKEEKAVENDQKNVNIDFDGIYDRVVEITPESGYYWNIKGVEGGIYYIQSKIGSNSSKLIFFKFEDQKETEIGSNMNFTISGNGKKMLINSMGKYTVTDLPKAAVKIDEAVDLLGMKIWVDPKAEWQQIYDESWRQMKYFFYDPGMHGVNWDKMHEKYNLLLPHVNSRYDLSYVIGEMIGELNVGHAYVNDGDLIKPERIATGLLGAELSHHKSGFYQIDKILKGQNWNKNIRSPLMEPGLGIKEGDFIIAVNGQTTKEMNDIYASLVGKSGTTVEISVNSLPSESGARKVLIQPIANESELYYYNWVHDNIDKVNKATNGEVGYIHIPDMGPGGLNQFVRYYYPQLRKKALIIDDRGNGGGNVSPMIIERLRRELSMMAAGRNSVSYSKPDGMMAGPLVCLINRYSASDGDLFPYQFRKHNLGPLIGTRTWGGVVGIRGSLPFIDGGSLMKPEFAHYSADGKEWIIEGTGVEPDIEIWNDPALEFSGVDQQLNKAIEVILELLKDYPDPQYPIAPPFPDKSK